MKLLEQLCAVHGPSGDEHEISSFLLRYVNENRKDWKHECEVIYGAQFQDCIMLKFGRPRTAVFAHMDTVGFTVRYENQLLPIGSPDAPSGTLLVGQDRMGPIECELYFDEEHHAFYKFGRQIERGTSLTYKSNFVISRSFIESPYLDNRLGIYSALKLAETLKDGIIVFSSWEEHGGGSVPFLAKHIYETYKVSQALISDITWISDGVDHGKGVAISMRDRNIPRQSFIRKIIQIAVDSKIDHQLEVEGMGSSDGRELQVSPYPFDWCFIGAPELNAHSPIEKVHKHDIKCMISLYETLMKEL